MFFYRIFNTFDVFAFRNQNKVYYNTSDVKPLTGNTDQSEVGMFFSQFAMKCVCSRSIILYNYCHVRLVHPRRGRSPRAILPVEGEPLCYLTQEQQLFYYIENNSQFCNLQKN